MDYTIFYKEEIPYGNWPQARQWDLFISAFNPSDRVTRPFDFAQAAGRRDWLVLPEYGFSKSDVPAGAYWPKRGELSEVDVINGYLDEAFGADVPKSVCIDITGFIKPYLMFLIKRLRELGVMRFDALFSEPMKYKHAEKTKFSDGPVTSVRQVGGFEGVHLSETANDQLLVGVGYDDRLIRKVAEEKRHANKVQMFGLPSLRADMYQQNVLCADRASTEMDGGLSDSKGVLHAAANDPFLVAKRISEWYKEKKLEFGDFNLYLSPLSTKPQCLGFVIFAILEGDGEAVSILYPYSQRHAPSTGEGLARTWQYTVELD